MNSYTCDNCYDPSDTLISHPYVTGQDNGFDPQCFLIMANTLIVAVLCRGVR